MPVHHSCIFDSAQLLTLSLLLVSLHLASSMSEDHKALLVLLFVVSKCRGSGYCLFL